MLGSIQKLDPIFEFLKLLLCFDVALSSPIAGPGPRSQGLSPPRHHALSYRHDVMQALSIDNIIGLESDDVKTARE